jgi:hypothetical protein
MVNLTSRPPLPLRKSPSPVPIVGTRSGLDDVEKERFLTLPGPELKPVRRLASRYTDCAIPALATDVKKPWKMNR